MPNTQSPSTDEYLRRICRAVDYINAHLAEMPSVGEIADSASFSSFHFQRLFRAIVGETVAEFTRRVRLEAAARHLIYGAKDDITGLAMELGFSSSQNFAKAFKQHFGVSPSQYRDSHAGAPASSHEQAAAFSWPQPLKFEGQVVVRSLPTQRVAYRRHFGSYHDPEVQAGFEELERWAIARSLHADDHYLGIPWDDAEITPEQKCRFDACLLVAEDTWLGVGVNSQIIPAGKYATFRTIIIGHDFDLPWTQLMRSWLPTSGYQPADGPRFERYYSDGSHDPEGRWDLEVCLPVRPL